MSDIKLVNKNGKIVGIDPETGNEVPIELGDAVADSLSAGDLYNDQLPDVVIKRDGSDAVALDTAGGQEIDRADAVSGRGSYPVIQSAVDFLGSDGGHIHLVSGRYSADNFSDFNGDGPLVEINKDHVTISGDGPSTLLTIEDGALPDTEGFRLLHATGKSGNLNRTQFDLVIRDLKLDGNQQNNNGKGDGNTIDNSIDGHNIQIQARDFLLSNVHSVNSTGDGVEPISRTTESDGDPQTKNGVINGCIFKDNWEQNVHIHGGKNIVVSDCTMDGEINNDNINLFSEQTNVENVAFVGNVIVNGDNAGANLETDNATVARNIVFANNIVRGNRGEGIAVHPTSSDMNVDNMLITGNLIHNNGEGIRVSGGTDITIQNNIVKDNAKAGLRLSNARQPVTNVVVQNNLLKDNVTGGAGTSDRANLFVVAKNDTNSWQDVMICENMVIDTVPNCLFAIETRTRNFPSRNRVYIKNNYVRGSQNDPPINDQFGSVLLWNEGNDDAVSEIPFTADTGGASGVIYLDDGTNTADSDPHLRYNNGGSFFDL
jgi:parallel beta-helix repeat protein